MAYFGVRKGERSGMFLQNKYGILFEYNIYGELKSIVQKIQNLNNGAVASICFNGRLEAENRGGNST